MLRIPKYCGFCGTKYAESQRIACEKAHMIACRHCKEEHYLNSLPVANVIIPHHGGIILQLRAHEPGKNLWSMPGGYVGIETWQHAAAREAKEETRVIIYNPDDAIVHFSTESRKDGVQLIVFGLMRTRTRFHVGSFKQNSESLERRVLKPDEWPAFQEQIAFNMHRKAIEKYFAMIA